MIVYQNDEASRRKFLRVGLQAVLLHARKAVCHCDAGITFATGRAKQPSTKLDAANPVELDICSLHSMYLSRSGRLISQCKSGRYRLDLQGVFPIPLRI